MVSNMMPVVSSWEQLNRYLALHQKDLKKPLSDNIKHTLSVSL